MRRRTCLEGRGGAICDPHADAVGRVRAQRAVTPLPPPRGMARGRRRGVAEDAARVGEGDMGRRLVTGGPVADATAGSALMPSPTPGAGPVCAWRAGIGDSGRVGDARIGRWGTSSVKELRRAHCSPSPVGFVCLLTEYSYILGHFHLRRHLFCSPIPLVGLEYIQIRWSIYHCYLRPLCELYIKTKTKRIRR
jgi:hypothetical protein